MTSPAVQFDHAAIALDEATKLLEILWEAGARPGELIRPEAWDLARIAAGVAAPTPAMKLLVGTLMRRRAETLKPFLVPLAAPICRECNGSGYTFEGDDPDVGYVGAGREKCEGCDGSGMICLHRTCLLTDCTCSCHDHEEVPVYKPYYRSAANDPDGGDLCA